MRTRSISTTSAASGTSSERARNGPASTTARERTIDPGFIPRARMSSLNELKAIAWATRGSATKVPRPCRRYTAPSATSRSISPRTVIRASP